MWGVTACGLATEPFVFLPKNLMTGAAKARIVSRPPARAGPLVSVGGFDAPGSGAAGRSIQRRDAGSDHPDGNANLGHCPSSSVYWGSRGGDGAREQSAERKPCVRLRNPRRPD